jgi:hypothetical protein
MPSANAEGVRTKIDLFLDRSPAGGTIAAFDFTEVGMSAGSSQTKLHLLPSRAEGDRCPAGPQQTFGEYTSCFSGKSGHEFMSTGPTWGRDRWAPFSSMRRLPPDKWHIATNLCPIIASFQRRDLVHKRARDGCRGHFGFKDRFVHAVRTPQSMPATAAALRKLRSNHAARSNNIAL